MKRQGSAGIIVLIVAVVILALAVVGMGVYIFTSNMIVAEDIGNEKIEQNVIEENTQVDKNEEEKVDVSEQKIDVRKYHVTNDLNEEKDVLYYAKDIVEHEYFLGFFDDTYNGIVTRISTNKKGNIWVDASISGKTVFPTKEFPSSLFDKKVDEIEIIDFYQGGQNAIVYFLLEDGSVEYIDLAELLVKQDISTKKKVDGLSNIVRIERIDARPANDGGGWQTGVAIDVNGNWTMLDEHAKSVFDNNSYNETFQKLVNKYKQN